MLITITKTPDNSVEVTVDSRESPALTLRTAAGESVTVVAGDHRITLPSR